jgi:hypothetical protein
MSAFINKPDDEGRDDANAKLPAAHRQIIAVANEMGYFPTRAQAKAISRTAAERLCNPPIVIDEAGNAKRVPFDPETTRDIWNWAVRSVMASPGRPKKSSR